jgi:hypothetical protein
MNERSVQLHVRTPTERQDFGLGSGEAQSSLPQTPDDGSSERFKQAMKASDLAPEVPLPGETKQAEIGTPMALFGATSAVSTGNIKPGVMNALKDSLKGLQVGHEQRSVRMELDDALYPGVAVAVFEDAGAWVAEFRCSQMESYRSLSEPAADMARQLAKELKRDTVWRVLDESEGQVADGDTDHTTEAFASAPPG